MSAHRLTREQAAVIGLYTGITCGPFADVHKKAEEVLGHPVWTHEFANPETVEKLKELIKPEFIALCAQEG